jgi:hypothetical protein
MVARWLEIGDVAATRTKFWIRLAIRNLRRQKKRPDLVGGGSSLVIT